MVVTFRFSLDHTWDKYKDSDDIEFMRALFIELADGIEYIDIMEIENESDKN